MNELDKAYLPARDAFGKAGLAGRFALAAEPSSAESLARWFVVALKK